MERQHQIKRTLATPESIEVIRRLLAEGMHVSRAALVHATCNHFGFARRARPRADRWLRQGAARARARGPLRAAGSRPRGRRRGQAGSARRLGAPVPEPRDVPALAGDVRGLALLKVQTLEQMRLWNELMALRASAGTRAAGGRADALPDPVRPRLARRLGLRRRGAEPGRARSLDRLGRTHPARASASRGGHGAIPDPPLGALPQPCVASAGHGAARPGSRLPDPVRLPPLAGGELRGHRTVPGHQLPGGQLVGRRADPGARPAGPRAPRGQVRQGHLRLCAGSGLARSHGRARAAWTRAVAPRRGPGRPRVGAA